MIFKKRSKKKKIAKRKGKQTTKVKNKYYKFSKIHRKILKKKKKLTRNDVRTKELAPNQ